MTKQNSNSNLPTLHISKGNNKIGNGIYAFSTLPGNETHMLYGKDGELLTPIHGTCGKHCDTCFFGGCYAVNSAKRYHNTVIPAWADNTLLLRSGELWPMLKEYIEYKNRNYIKSNGLKPATIQTLRWNVSGEIQSANDLLELNKLAIAHPEITIGLYTKNYEALDEFLREYRTTNDNLVINVSQWHDVADEFLAAHPNAGLNIFAYDDSNRKNCTMSDAKKLELSTVSHCPSVLPNGKRATLPDGSPITCDICKRCYRKTGMTTAVYAH